MYWGKKLDVSILVVPAAEVDGVTDFADSRDSSWWSTYYKLLYKWVRGQMNEYQPAAKDTENGMGSGCLDIVDGAESLSEIG